MIAQPKACYQVSSKESIEAALFLYGPLSVGIGVSGAMQLYQSGIFEGPCASGINHTMTLVGYGKDYWILKNTWGTGWGEHGYMRIKKDICSVSNSVYFSKFQ